MSSNNNIITLQGPFYMPDGTPAPFVMTEEEPIKFLRIDTNKTKRPEMTIQFYINKQLLTPIKIGKFRKYPLSELLKFIENLHDEKQEDIS